MNQSDQRTKGSDRSETTDAKVMAYDKLQLITIFGLIPNTLELLLLYTVKPHLSVYNRHSREPENVPFMNSCPLYTGKNYMYYSLMGKIRLSFVDSELLYTL